MIELDKNRAAKRERARDKCPSGLSGGQVRAGARAGPAKPFCPARPVPIYIIHGHLPGQ